MADAEAAYMDDELGDLDDVIDEDDDDAPLLPASGRGKAIGAASAAAARKGALPPGGAASGPSTSNASADKLPLNPETHRAYTLYVAAARSDDVVVARFRDALPELPAPGAGSVRLYREGEESVAARIAAARAGERQAKYFNSYSGRRRGEHNQLVGITTVPDRVKRKWNLELFSEPNLATAPHAALERARRGGESAGDPSGAATANEAGTAAAAAAVAAGGVPPHSGAPPFERHTRRGPLPYAAYVGQFEGEQAAAHYAYLLVDDDSRTAEIVPLGPHARYLFRTRHGAGTGRARTVEEAEQAMKARESAGGKRLARLIKSYDSGRAETSSFSIRRTAATMARGKEEEAERHVGLDYKETFDDDDLAQVEEPELAERGDDEEEDVDEAENMDILRRMIKDEPLADRPGPPGPRRSLSPGADDDDSDDDDGEDEDAEDAEEEGEEGADGADASAAAAAGGPAAAVLAAAGDVAGVPAADKARRRRSTSMASDAPSAAARRGRSPSPAPSGDQRVPSGGAAKRRSASPVAGAGGAAGGAASRGTTPVPGAKRFKKEASPAPSLTPSADGGGGGGGGGTGTPRPSPPPPDRACPFGHLLPAAGVAVTEAHFVDILTFMEAAGKRLQLKELLARFDLSTEEKKKRVWDVMRKIATITRDAADTKAHYVSLKDAYRPPAA